MILVTKTKAGETSLQREMISVVSELGWYRGKDEDLFAPAKDELCRSGWKGLFCLGKCLLCTSDWYENFSL